MRVALLGNAYLPHAGGSRLYYHNLLKRIASPGYDVTVLTTKVPGWREFDAKEQTPNFHIRRHFHPLPDLSYKQLPKLVGPLLVTLAHVLRHRPQLLHCGDLYPCGVIGLACKRIFGIPYVAYCHGEDITLTDQRRFQPKLRDMIYRSADVVIANGEFAIENLRRIGIPAHKVRKITPGLDESLFHPLPPDAALRQRFGITNQLVVMTVARLASRKGHARIIRALAALLPELPPVRYIIVGRGHLEAELRLLVQSLALEDVVTFAGFVPEEELNSFYNLADIVAMPNTADAGDMEGFGMVFLEANAAGKPVIGGRSGGTGEAILHGVTGLLVDPDDDQELHDALRSLLQNRELRIRMGQAGLARVRSDFGWDCRASALRDASAALVRDRKIHHPIEQRAPREQ